jgi:ATP-dependent DNA ligase
MLLLPTETLPEAPGWTHELKLDGYRAIGLKTGGEVRLRSRNDKDFNRKYPVIARALEALPDETVIDGEVVALDPAGRPSFNALQNGAAGAAIFFYVFDVMVLGGRTVMGETLASRRDLLSHEVLPTLADPVREAPRFDAALADLIAAVRAQGLEGLVAKRLDSVYEPGARSGAWRKMRINRSEKFVIGGYTKGGRTFDAIVIGRWEGERLVYVARTRVGFTPANRERLMARLRPIEVAKCPFANLPEARSGRWDKGLTAEKMKECVWVRPEPVAELSLWSGRRRGICGTRASWGCGTARCCAPSLRTQADFTLLIQCHHVHWRFGMKPEPSRCERRSPGISAAMRAIPGLRIETLAPVCIGFECLRSG